MFGFFRKKIESTEPDFLRADNSEEKVDMNNIIQSIFNAEPLYNKLKIKCHPDRFVHDKVLMHRADDLFKEITENKRNFNKLQELKLIAEKELNIKL